MQLAPFIDRSLLEEMVQRLGLDNFTPRQVAALAPFLTAELLAPYIETMASIDNHDLLSLAPFVKPEQLGRLVDGLNEALTLQQLSGLALFLPSEKLSKLFVASLGTDHGEFEFWHLAQLAPFLPAHQLKALLEACPPRSIAELSQVAPFLDRSAVNAITKRLIG